MLLISSNENLRNFVYISLTLIIQQTPELYNMQLYLPIITMEKSLVNIIEYYRVFLGQF